MHTFGKNMVQANHASNTGEGFVKTAFVRNLFTVKTITIYSNTYITQNM